MANKKSDKNLPYIYSTEQFMEHWSAMEARVCKNLSDLMDLCSLYEIEKLERNVINVRNETATAKRRKGRPTIE